MGNVFNTFLGLPVHPLVDHFAVVLFPLALLMLLGIIAVRSWRRRYGWLTMVLLTLGTAAVLAAKESGEQLARTLGTPHDHARWADALVWVALPGWLVSLAWFVVDRTAHLRARRASASSGHVDADARPDPSALRGILAGTAGLAALTSLVLVTMVGHTGAKATWARPAPVSPSSTASPSGTPGASASAMPHYRLAQVATHNTPGSCWTAVNGGVYDLTDWISQHPGGPDPIRSICGKDGSAAFNQQHSKDARPQQFLAQYRIGTLG